jgi:hypothetical protein
MPYNLEIENPFIVEDDDFVVYSTQSLKTFSEKNFNELKSNKNRILDYFGLSNFRKVIVIFFDDLNEFRKYVLSLREKGALLPDYAIGVFDKGMIISFVDLSSIKDEKKFESKAKTSVHEFIHIVNKEMVYKKRVVWLDEGLATNLDNLNIELTDDNKFKEFITNKILTIKELPVINDLKHGNGFKNEYYNAYDLVYLCVRYLIETMDKKEFQKVLRDYDLTIKIGETLLRDAINYYRNRLNL